MTEEQTPRRVRLSRARGWRKPENTLVVARGTVYGNPFRVYEHCKGPDGDWGIEDTGRFCAPMGHGWTRLGAVKAAIDAYRRELDSHFPPGSGARYGLVQYLTGQNLACWCPLDEPCHADVLLEVANGGAR